MKKMIKGLKVVLIVIILSFVFLSIMNGTFLKKEYLIENDQYDDSLHKMTPSQFYLIKSGISAASSHNMQPWKITIENNDKFTLNADLNKRLPIVDQSNNQLLISQGTFIENVKYAAEQSNIELNVDYLPINLEDDHPSIATFTITNSIDSELDVITQTTYIPSTHKTLNLEEIVNQTGTQYPLSIELVTDTRMIKLKNLLRSANKIESENEEAMNELLNVFRFSRWDMNQYKYGLSLNTIHPLIGFFINPILDVFNDWKQFGQSSITVFEERLGNEFGYILVKTQNPSQSDYVQTGELLSKLSHQLNGYRIQPTYQILEDLPGMDNLKNQLMVEFGHDEEIIMIIGISNLANQNYFSLRHKVEDIVEY